MTQGARRGRLRGKDRIVVALDVGDLAAARSLAHRVAAHVGVLKVGAELFVAEGTAAVALGREVGLPVFLDLKLHDIPETVERTVARAAALGVRWLTVHASGGHAMLDRAARRARAEGDMSLVAVTVLTSLEDADLRTLGVGGTAREQAMRLARLAHGAGIRHFVCSPHEAEELRAALGPKAVLFTPGIRPAGHDAMDQKRTATPASAIRAGADFVVIGRPIRDAADPAEAARAIAAEIDAI